MGQDDDDHRYWGAQLFNRAWDLLESGEAEVGQEPAAQRELLAAALGSRWHWGQVGGPRERVIGDWQVAHVAARLGHGPLAVEFARAALAEVEEWDETPPWLLASCYEGMARACRAVADQDGYATWAERCRVALADIDDEESRQLIASQLESIP